MICHSGYLQAAATVEVADDRGRIFTFQAPPQRIITLTPHLTELLYLMEGGDRLVATVEFSNYPPAAQSVPRIGNYERLDMEQLLALKPDLVLGWDGGNPSAMLDRIEKLGLPLFRVVTATLEDVARGMRQVGALLGHRGRGEAASVRFLAELQQLQGRYRERRAVKVFYQLWHQPIMTLESGGVIEDVIARCGGESLFSGLKGIAPTVSEEAVLAAAPEVIIAAGMGQKRPQWLDNWRRWQSLPAVQGEHLYSLDPDLIHRQGPRILQGMRTICEAIDRAR
uniref:Putative vitamin B12 transport protein n=1 Tax=Magnetococcus massalia (strain MO-1) TaxID=451514 RepID=A0A1S7LQX5_MAGMO|nr:Putative vitamin B12 transport protein [Candidatus Magnetococcus massalia]